MKKLYGFAITLLLIMGLAPAALAGTVSLDIWTGGEYEYRSSGATTTYDLPQIALGVEIPGTKYKFACNLNSGIITDYDTDYGYENLGTASILLKGGYALINRKKIRLDLTAGFFNRQINFDYLIYSTTRHDYVDIESYYSLTAGLDAKVMLNQKAWLDCSYSMGIYPRAERTYFYKNSVITNLDSISITNFKLNYLLNRRIGVALGYYCENIEFDHNDQDQYSNVTFGGFFKF
jgi:hypothetical protein